MAINARSNSIIVGLFVPLIGWAALTPTLPAQESPANQRAAFFDTLDFNGDGVLTQDEILQPANTVDLVIGSKGNSLQLVLSSLYHQSMPSDNVSYSFYQQFIEYEDPSGKKIAGRFSSAVELAVPLCLGDSYEGFRVVGTTSDYLDKLDFKNSKKGPVQKHQFAEGRNFKQDDTFGAVVGAEVAKKTGLSIGDALQLTHGIGPDGHRHSGEFKLLGILAPSGMPNDRTLFVNMEGFYLLEGHAFDSAVRSSPAPPASPVRKDAQGVVLLPDENREVTAILIRTDLDNPIAAQALAKYINKGNEAIAVQPYREIYQLLNRQDDISLFYSLGPALRESTDQLKRATFSEQGQSP